MATPAEGDEVHNIVRVSAGAVVGEDAPGDPVVDVDVDRTTLLAQDDVLFAMAVMLQVVSIVFLQNNH